MQIQALLPLLLCIVGVCIAQGPGDVNLGPSDHNCTGLTFAEPNPDRCDQYFICFTVTVDLWQCSPSGNFLFDERYMGCNYPEYTSCGNRPRPTSSVKPTVSTTPLPPFHCPSSTGNFPVDPSQKCSQTYYMCVNGEPFQQTCPGPLVFNVNTCMSAEAAGCSVPTTTPSQGFTCPTQDGFFPVLGHLHPVLPVRRWIPLPQKLSSRSLLQPCQHTVRLALQRSQLYETKFFEKFNFRHDFERI